MTAALYSDHDGERVNLRASENFMRSKHGWYGYRKGRLTDLAFDVKLQMTPAFRKLVRTADTMPLRNIHIASVDVPKRRKGLDAVLRALKDTRHKVSVSLAPIGDRGKFTNINLALAETDLSTIDWLIVVDDDIAFPHAFLDRFLCCCEEAALQIAQPAHRFRSHTTWTVTQRLWTSLVHTTNYVECGPVTAFHRDVFKHVLPFPETRWAWGIDVLWGEIARRENFSIGVVDATPIEHLRPVSANYDYRAAMLEMDQFLTASAVHRSNAEIFAVNSVLKHF